MKKSVDKDESTSLLESEARILLALAASQASGYEIARQCEKDSADNIEMSNGTVYPALRRLKQWSAVEVAGEDPSGPGKPAKVWRITQTGRMLLEWELASYRRMVRLGQERL
jgi:DNA-binding PadR family transcriptional regulator